VATALILGLQLRWWLVCVMLIAVFAVGCGAKAKDDPGTDTSTDWVASCDADRECHPDQRCGCGLCTHECDTDADCRDLSPTAVCEWETTRCGEDETVCVPHLDYFSSSDSERADDGSDDQANIAAIESDGGAANNAEDGSSGESTTEGASS